MKFLTILLILLSVGTVTHAQNIKTATITWSAGTVFNPLNGETKDETHKVISTDSSVEWQSPTGVQTFQVVQVLGQWTDVTNAGEIIFEIKGDQRRGTMTFLKNASGTTVRMTLIDDTDALPVSLELKVLNIESN